MMGATRRQFLSGAAAATAGVALLDVRATASSQCDEDSRPIDEQVAVNFFARTRHEDPTELASPRVVGLLYGLLCTDFSGSEVLLPNAAGITGVEAHHARLWVVGEVVEASQSATPDGMDTDGEYSYFDIAGYSLTFKTFDSGGSELPDPSSVLKKRERAQHPWMNLKWVRCLKQLTGLSLISEADREKTNFVSARVKLKTGRVAAIPPSSSDGQHSEWRVKQSDGKVVVSATTDSMQWSRPLRQVAATLRIQLTPLGGSTATKTIVLKVDDQKVLLAITHATHKMHSDPTHQTDSKAFARLLKNGDPNTYPVPELEGMAVTGTSASASDVHCECASCP
jgi:hypothetical protein